MRKLLLFKNVLLGVVFLFFTIKVSTAQNPKEERELDSFSLEALTGYKGLVDSITYYKADTFWGYGISYQCFYDKKDRLRFFFIKDYNYWYGDESWLKFSCVFFNEKEELIGYRGLRTDVSLFGDSFFTEDIIHFFDAKNKIWLGYLSFIHASYQLGEAPNISDLSTQEILYKKYLINQKSMKKTSKGGYLIDDFVNKELPKHLKIVKVVHFCKWLKLEQFLLLIAEVIDTKDKTSK